MNLNKPAVSALISVIIPTLNARGYLEPLLQSLRGQTTPPDEILIVDSQSVDGTVARAREMGCRVIEISPQDFHHGATRNMAVDQATGEVVLFLTQDVLPCHGEFIERMAEPIIEGEVAATYGRQIPQAQATPVEAFMRKFRYPPESRLQSPDRLNELGVQTFYFSNAASAVSREIFLEAGGFHTTIPSNEDMLFCARLIRAGYSVLYQAEARVLHSHSYGPIHQFRRYFDIGVSISREGVLLGRHHVDPEGLRFVRTQMRYLLRESALLWIPYALMEDGLKWIGYRLGLWERHLPLWFNRWCSNAGSRFWQPP